MTRFNEGRTSGNSVWKVVLCFGGTIMYLQKPLMMKSGKTYELSTHEVEWITLSTVMNSMKL